MTDEAHSKEAASTMERRATFRCFSLILTLFLIIRFWSIFIGSEAFMLRDFSMFGYPLAAHLQNSLFAGELPLWNPLNQAGMPHLAQWNTMVLYPPMVLAALFPLAWSLSVFCILHQLLGGLGAWQLAHRFTNDRMAAALAGAAFVGNGLVQNCLMWPNNIAALGWMPWVILLFEKAARERGGAILLAGFVGALQMLTGGPEIILLTWIMAAGLVAMQAWFQAENASQRLKRILVVGELGLLVFALCAAQLLPFLELLKHSHREAGFGGNEWAATAHAWANLFVPLVGKTEAPGGVFFHINQSWTHSYHAGLPVLALAFMAPFIRSDRRMWIAAFACVAFLLTAMGSAGMIFPWLSKVPPLNLLRFPVKYLLPLSLLLPILAAIGFARLRQSEREPFCGRRFSILLALVVAGWVVAFLIGHGSDRMSAETYFWNSVIRFFIFGACAIVMTMILLHPAKKDYTGAASIFVVVLIAIDLQVHQPNLAPAMPAALYAERMPQLDELRENMPANSRAALTSLAIRNLNANSLPELEKTFLLRRLGMFGNANLMDGIPKVNGFYSLYLEHYREVQTVFHAGDDRLREPVADFLGVSRVMRYTNMFNWMDRAGAMPLVSGGQVPVFLKSNETLPAVMDAGFNPRVEVLFDVEEPGLMTTSERRPNANTVIKIAGLERSAHRIRFVAEAESPGFVVIAQPHYPAWRATVNGQRHAVMKANHAFQAVGLPTGRSEVVLEYRDGTLQVGAIISTMTLCLLLFGLVRGRRPIATSESN